MNNQDIPEKQLSLIIIRNYLNYNISVRKMS